MRSRAPTETLFHSDGTVNADGRAAKTRRMAAKLEDQLRSKTDRTLQGETFAEAGRGNFFKSKQRAGPIHSQRDASAAAWRDF